MATVGARNTEFMQMVEELAAQVQDFDGAIEVHVYWDNFERPLGHVRQSLLEAASSDYVNFVDDDDKVPPYYCDKVMACLDGVVDYVGWRMQLYVDGVAQKPTFHSLRYDRWWEDDKGYYRNVSHLNPIKRTLANLGRFDRQVPEDVDWAHQVAPFVLTEAYIPEVMYNYFYSPKASLWSKTKKPRGDFVRPTLPAHFYYHPMSNPGV